MFRVTAPVSWFISFILVFWHEMFYNAGSWQDFFFDWRSTRSIRPRYAPMLKKACRTVHIYMEKTHPWTVLKFRTAFLFLLRLRMNNQLSWDGGLSHSRLRLSLIPYLVPPLHPDVSPIPWLPEVGIPGQLLSGVTDAGADESSTTLENWGGNILKERCRWILLTVTPEAN